MERLIPIAIILVLMIIGFLIKILRMKKYNRRIDFSFDYHKKLFNLINTFMSSGNIDNCLYGELTEKVTLMQRELGADGVMHMIDPLKRIKDPNHAVLINFLPQIREMPYHQDDRIMRQRFDKMAQTCDDMFIRHIGRLKDMWEQERKHVFNPFICLRDGVQWILWLPSNILLWFGFISEATGQKLRDNWLIKMLTLLVTIIGLVGSIITIVIGWEQFCGMVAGWFGR